MLSSELPTLGLNLCTCAFECRASKFEHCALNLQLATSAFNFLLCALSFQLCSASCQFQALTLSPLKMGLRPLNYELPTLSFEVSALSCPLQSYSFQLRASARPRYDVTELKLLRQRKDSQVSKPRLKPRLTVHASYSMHNSRNMSPKVVNPPKKWSS